MRDLLDVHTCLGALLEASPPIPPHIAVHLDTRRLPVLAFIVLQAPSVLAAMSSALVWELVKHNNAFIHKGLNGATFSREAGNL